MRLHHFTPSLYRLYPSAAQDMTTANAVPSFKAFSEVARRLPVIPDESPQT